MHTVIEYNWSHDNQGGLFSLCNNPNDDTSVTDGTVVRFNVSENDGIRAFGFSGRVTHSIVYNNTVLIGLGHKEAIVEVRPFSKSKPRFADGDIFFNNVVIILGEASYDFAEATNTRFDSKCIVGSVEPPFSKMDAVGEPCDETVHCGVRGRGFALDDRCFPFRRSVLYDQVKATAVDRAEEALCLAYRKAIEPFDQQSTFSFSEDFRFRRMRLFNADDKSS